MQTHVRNPNKEHKESLTDLERLALWITKHVGTMGFFIILFCWAIFWLSWNIIGPEELRFDPYPAFVLWIFISNIIQLMMMPLIMVGQNLQSRHSEYRAEAEYELNVRAEAEIETIITRLEQISNDLKNKK